MDGYTFIVVMIAVCLALLMFILFAGPLKVIFKLILNVVIGMAAIYALNFFFPSIGVGINLFTAAVTGVLGVPGLVALVVAGIVL